MLALLSGSGLAEIVNTKKISKSMVNTTNPTLLVVIVRRV